MARKYFIFTNSVKFTITGFTQKIENDGGFPYVRYTFNGTPATGWIEASNRSLANPGNIPASEQYMAQPGDEVIVIGDAIHFNTAHPSGSFVFSTFGINWAPH